MNTRLQCTRMLIKQECPIDDFDWSKEIERDKGKPNDLHVQVLGMDYRVLYDCTLMDIDTTKMKKNQEKPFRKDMEVVSLSQGPVLRVNKWTERGMYDVSIMHSDDGITKVRCTLGHFPRRYVFLVVNGILLYTYSQYDSIEKEHHKMRHDFIAKQPV